MFITKSNTCLSVYAIVKLFCVPSPCLGNCSCFSSLSSSVFFYLIQRFLFLFYLFSHRLSHFDKSSVFNFSFCESNWKCHQYKCLFLSSSLSFFLWQDADIFSLSLTHSLSLSSHYLSYINFTLILPPSLSLSLSHIRNANAIRVQAHDLKQTSLLRTRLPIIHREYNGFGHVPSELKTLTCIQHTHVQKMENSLNGFDLSLTSFDCFSRSGRFVTGRKVNVKVDKLLKRVLRYESKASK